MNDSKLGWVMDKLDYCIDLTKSNFGTIESSLLFKKSNPSKWSAAECMAHIMILNESYFPQLQAIVDKEHRNPIISPFKKAIGRMLLSSVLPGAKARKTFSSFEPNNMKIENISLDAFLNHLVELRDLFNRLASESNPHKSVIHSPASKILKFSAADAMKILALHTERHIMQAIEQLAEIME